MAGAFTKLRNICLRIFAIGAGLSMAFIFLIIFINALIRYVWGSSLPWGDQLPVFLGIYGVMFGMAYAYLEDRHIRLGLLVDFISSRLRTALFLVVDIAVIVIGGLLAWSGYLFMASRGNMRVSGLSGTVRTLNDTTGLDLASLGTLGPYQFALALGGGMLCIAALIRTVERLQSLRSS